MYPTSKIAEEFTPALPNAAPAVPDDVEPPGVPRVGASDIFLKSSDFIKSRVPGQSTRAKSEPSIHPLPKAEYCYQRRNSLALPSGFLRSESRNRSVSLSSVIG